MPDSPRRATSIVLRSSAAEANRHTKSCRAFIRLPLYSRDGYLELFRAAFSTSTLIIISTSLHSDSIAAVQILAHCFFIAWLSKR